MEVLLIGGASGGPSSTDHFAPTVIVGNELEGDPAVSQAAPFEYIADPGDGTGIQAALAAIALGGGWVHIRRGIYTLDPAVLPLTVPGGCRVTGDGPGATILIASEEERRVFLVSGNDVELSRFQILLPEAIPGASGAAVIDVLGAQSLLERIHIAGPGTGLSADESLTSIIRLSGDAILQRCRLTSMPYTPNGILACVRIPGFGSNARVMDNFIQGGDYEIFADGTSGAATGLHILHNYCLGNANVNTCISLASGGSQQFVRGNRCINGEYGIWFAANGGHVSENQCYNQITNPIVLAGSGIVCLGNTVSTGAVISNLGAGNAVAHNTQF